MTKKRDVPPNEMEKRMGKHTPEDRRLCLELAQLSQQSHENRQAREWKVAFGLWIGLAILTWFVVQELAPLEKCSVICLSVAYAAFYLAWALLWQLPVHSANWQDREWKHWFMDQAENRAFAESSTRDPRHRTKCYWRIRAFTHAWFWGHLAVTAVFLLVSLLMIATAKTQPVSHPDGVDRLSGENVRLVLEKLPSTNPATQP